MPCSSAGYGPSFEDQVRKELENVEDMLADVDWKEQGITIEQAQEWWLQEWWLDHQKRDRDRKRREIIAAEKAAKKQAALAKLSDEDKKILGLK